MLHLACYPAPAEVLPLQRRSPISSPTRPSLTSSITEWHSLTKDGLWMVIGSPSGECLVMSAYGRRAESPIVSLQKWVQ